MLWHDISELPGCSQLTFQSSSCCETFSPAEPSNVRYSIGSVEVIVKVHKSNLPEQREVDDNLIQQ